MGDPHGMRLPDLDFDLLRCFIAVAETRGFTAAGRRLGLSQSAISLRIGRLEGLVGRRILERTSRSVTLSRDGETLLSYARRIVALNEEAVRRLIAPPVAGRLRLGVADHFVPRGLTALLAGFATTHPDLRLEVEVGRSHELRASLAAGKLDLVLGKRRDGETEGRPIRREGLAWVAAPHWTAPAGRALPLAMLPPGCLLRERALAALARAGMASEIVYTSASLLGVAAAAEAGLAVTVLGRSFLPAGLRAQPLLPPLGEAEMCLFGEDTVEPTLAEPLVAALHAHLVAMAP